MTNGEAEHTGSKSTDSLVLPGLDRFERLNTIFEIAGFMPVSLAEQTEVMGLQTLVGTKVGAAKHLAEVTRHQLKAGMEDTGEAPRNIVHAYVDSAIDAESSSAELSLLQDELNQDQNPELVIELVTAPQTPGIVKLLRWFDLNTLRQSRNVSSVGYDPQKVDYSTDNPGIMFYVAEAMRKWTVHQARQELPRAINDQHERFFFFITRLEEVRDHSPRTVAEVARQGLDTFSHEPL